MYKRNPKKFLTYLLCFDLCYQIFPKQPNITVTRGGFHKSHKTGIHVSICFFLCLLFSSNSLQKTKRAMSLNKDG